MQQNSVYKNLTSYFIVKLQLFSVPAAVIVWDSQVQDGYKRDQNHREAEGTSRKGPCSAPVGWDGKKSCDVVEELLKNSSDKAYGIEGEFSVISQLNLVHTTSVSLRIEEVKIQLQVILKLLCQAFQMKMDNFCL